MQYFVPEKKFLDNHLKFKIFVIRIYSYYVVFPSPGKIYFSYGIVYCFKRLDFEKIITVRTCRGSKFTQSLQLMSLLVLRNFLSRKSQKKLRRDQLSECLFLRTFIRLLTKRLLDLLCRKSTADIFNSIHYVNTGPLIRARFFRGYHPKLRASIHHCSTLSALVSEICPINCPR